MLGGLKMVYCGGAVSERDVLSAFKQTLPNVLVRIGKEFLHIRHGGEEEGVGGIKDGLLWLSCFRKGCFICSFKQTFPNVLVRIGKEFLHIRHGGGCWGGGGGGIKDGLLWWNCFREGCFISF